MGKKSIRNKTRERDVLFSSARADFLEKAYQVHEELPFYIYFQFF